MRSRLIGRTIVVDVRMWPQLIEYRSDGGSIESAGRIYLTDAGGGRTDVIMQSTARLGGWLRVVATDGMVRDRQREKLIADLRDLHRLGRAWRARAETAKASRTPRPE